MKILIAHAMGLEYGWHLMKYQAKIRYKSKNYDKTFIVVDQEYMYLYKDFASHISFFNEYAFSHNLKPDMWRFGNADIDYIYPTKELCCSTGNDAFISYGVKGNTRVPIVVIHPRRKNDNREWPQEKWNRFVEELRTVIVADIFVIGKIKDTHGVKGVNIADFRDSSLSTVCDILAKSVLCVGPSSGPIHLASLCKCPHLVWTDDKRWNLGVRKGTNRERYEHYWNPFKTPVTVIDSNRWNPPVKLIVNKVKELLNV